MSLLYPAFGWPESLALTRVVKEEFPLTSQNLARNKELTRKGWSVWKERRASLALVCHRPVQLNVYSYKVISFNSRMPWHKSNQDPVSQSLHGNKKSSCLWQVNLPEFEPHTVWLILTASIVRCRILTVFSENSFRISITIVTALPWMRPLPLQYFTTMNSREGCH